MTPTVVAFIEDGPPATPVIAMARALSEVLNTSMAAIHVGEDVNQTTRDIAAEAQAPLRVVPGEPIEQIVAEMSSRHVIAGVLGARRQPAGPRPVGHTALEVITRVDKPVAVVPPDAIVPLPEEFDRILVPLNGTTTSAKAVEVVCDAYARSGVEILVLHVFDKDTTPGFWDQPHHAAEAFGAEFLARFARHPGAKVTLRSGIPEQSVLAAALEEWVDVIALGWSQRLDPGRAGVVRQVLSEAPMPVLLVPTDREPE